MLCAHTGAPLAPLVPKFLTEEKTKLMKLFQTLLVAGSVALPALLPAASPSDSLYVHVPFQFVAAGQSFSPGDYHIESAENGVILIQGNGKAAAAITFPGSMSKPGAPTGLKFSSDGHQKRLVGVQVQGEATRTLPSPEQTSKKAILSSR
jgi:hypothetical protein